MPDLAGLFRLRLALSQTLNNGLLTYLHWDRYCSLSEHASTFDAARQADRSYWDSRQKLLEHGKNLAPRLATAGYDPSPVLRLMAYEASQQTTAFECSRLWELEVKPSLDAVRLRVEAELAARGEGANGTQPDRTTGTEPAPQGIDEAERAILTYLAKHAPNLKHLEDIAAATRYARKTVGAKVRQLIDKELVYRPTKKSGVTVAKKSQSPAKTKAPARKAR